MKFVIFLRAPEKSSDVQTINGNVSNVTNSAGSSGLNALEIEFESSNPGCSIVKCFFLLAFSSSLFLSLSPHCMLSLSHTMPVLTRSSVFDLLPGRQKDKHHRKILAAPSVRQIRI